jgi:glycosyltransferase involved in cell wall biosynthesis
MTSIRNPQSAIRDPEKVKGLVSAIIIFLNAEKFMEEAVESVLAQSYDNWELLLVDDGSEDNSATIARGYERKYRSRVRCFEHDGHKNQGMSASRNLGLYRARGEYIAFLDADDVWMPHKLEQQVAIMDSRAEAAMVYGRTLIWFSWSGGPEDEHRDHFFPLGVHPGTIVNPPALFLLMMRNKVQTPTTCNAMLRRETFEEVGGFQDSFRGMFEDQLFFAKVCLKLPVFVSDECWAKYRQHPDSHSAIAERKGEADSARLTFLNWITVYISDQGIDCPTVLKAVSREAWQCRHPQIHHLFWQTVGKFKWIALQTLPGPVISWLRTKRDQVLQKHGML